ncbi:MAG: universal stress protein [Paracoccus sp. (in: a-proteobacteria)]|uniref:universal stress protein n=1 Tax=Paracoccus sp. TaxID=267 RepID=UPI0026DF091D|nr:universal stress protein [Paracoccus sp. (in: a-proteobacteria)]MDO5614202.1 universal stress protein [Paracoccus sp. (in: a-proteobacteria)]
MSFKTILTVITDPSQTSQLDAAAALALREDAHLEVFCLGVDHSQVGYYYAGASAYVFQESIDKSMTAAETLEKTVRDRLTPNTALRWSVDSAVAQSGGLTTLIGMRARFADVMVQNHPYGDTAPPDAEAVTEAAMFEGGCPVLVLPRGDLPTEPPKKVMVAWNQSNEAIAAVRRALPLLVAAESVEITVVDPKPFGPERSDPGGALCQMLVRHGARAEIAVLARTEPAISDVLIRRAQETGADMIVMGAYGHSRFREAILGGATRNMLENSPVAVFMAR